MKKAIAEKKTAKVESKKQNDSNGDCNRYGTKETINATASILRTV
jgi:hypothetical protein